MQNIKFGCTATPCNLWGVTEKIARSGLCYQHLQSAYEQNGKDEIQAHFSEKFKWESTHNKIPDKHILCCSALHRSRILESLTGCCTKIGALECNAY